MSEWTKLTDPKFQDRKWALIHDGVMLATIFKKPPVKNHPEVYSLYVSSPKIYAAFNEIMKTHTFSTLEAAQQAFEDLSRKEALPWAKAIVDYLK